MSNVIDLPSTIPVFPLPGALLLPRARLPLFIFEPRYLVMLDDVLKTSHRLLGMVQPCDGEQSGGALNKVGCAGRLTAFSELEDGRYMITLLGVSRFDIVEEEQGFTPYRKCTVDWTPYECDTGGAETDRSLDRERLLNLTERYFEAQNQLPDIESLRQAEDEFLVNSLAMICPFAAEDKQALLQAPNLHERQKTLSTLLEYALRGGSNERLM